MEPLNVDLEDMKMSKRYQIFLEKSPIGLLFLDAKRICTTNDADRFLFI